MVEDVAITRFGCCDYTICALMILLLYSSSLSYGGILCDILHEAHCIYKHEIVTIMSWSQFSVTMLQIDEYGEKTNIWSSY